MLEAHSQELDLDWYCLREFKDVPPHESHFASDVSLPYVHYTVSHLIHEQINGMGGIFDYFYE